MKVSESSEPTHVLTSDCIISEIGRCEAGTMISEGDVLPSTWQWLLNRNFLKSVAEIESEADAEDENSETDSEPNQQTEESASSDVPESTSQETTTEQAEPAATVESQLTQEPSVSEEKPTGRKARKS